MFPSRIATITALCIFVALPAFSQDPSSDPSLSESAAMHQELGKSKAEALANFRDLAARAARYTEYGYDVTFYELDLRFDPATQKVAGTVTMRARVDDDRPQALTTVQMDLYSNMVVAGVGGDATGYTHQDNVLQVTIPEHNPREFFEVSIAYSGSPLATGFGSFSFSQHNGAQIISSLSEPYYARTWWPCKDTPSDKADSARMRFTVPEGIMAISNGVLVATTTEENWTTYEWFEKYPITTYLISIAATNYRVYQDWYVRDNGDSLSLPYYIYPERYDDAMQNLRDTPTMLQAFEKYFGPYPFWGEKYGMAQFPWSGGMEHQTCTSLCCFGDFLVAHELAHQWWGDMITCRNWQHIWLNEGFASYGEALYAEFRDGAQAYRNYMIGMANSFSGRIFVDDTLSVSKIFAGIVYDKGAWVLHMLRGVVGDSAFFKTFKAYREDPALFYGTATTEDFQRHAEEVSGMDLGAFFRQWIYSPGQPRYVYGWQSAPVAAGYKIDLVIRQDQSDTTTFHMPITVRVEYANGSEDFRITNNLRCESYTLTVSEHPSNVLLDPDDWILKTVYNVPFVTLEEDCSLVPITFGLSPAFPNPLNLADSPRRLVVRYRIDRSTQVKLRIFNILGQEVTTLVNRRQEPNSYDVNWDARDGNGAPVPSGIYFVYMEAGRQSAQRKILILR